MAHSRAVWGMAYSRGASEWWCGRGENVRHVEASVNSEGGDEQWLRRYDTRGTNVIQNLGPLSHFSDHTYHTCRLRCRGCRNR